MIEAVLGIIGKIVFITYNQTDEKRDTETDAKLGLYQWTMDMNGNQKEVRINLISQDCWLLVECYTYMYMHHGFIIYQPTPIFVDFIVERIYNIYSHRIYKMTILYNFYEWSSYPAHTKNGIRNICFIYVCTESISFPICTVC